MLLMFQNTGYSKSYRKGEQRATNGILIPNFKGLYGRVNGNSRATASNRSGDFNVLEEDLTSNVV
jgi:hypothetical protein